MFVSAGLVNSASCPVDPVATNEEYQSASPSTRKLIVRVEVAPGSSKGRF